MPIQKITNIKRCHRGSVLCVKQLLVLALLICNAARGFASRLARGLALAAAAGRYGLCNIFGFDRCNSFHEKTLLCCSLVKFYHKRICLSTIILRFPCCFQREIRFLIFSPQGYTRIPSKSA